MGCRGGSRARRGVSGPAAAVIFLAVGAAVLLSTSYITDIFGSASFQKKVAAKLMMSRPYQVGAEVLSLIDSAYNEAAVQSSLEVGGMGAGRAVWYCNAPQPATVSEVKAALCERTHYLADALISSRTAPYNYSVKMPDCIYLNITGPESFALYTQGQEVSGPGVSSIGSTSIEVSNRFWQVYSSVAQWVDDDMGGLFENLCERASKACQARVCSCDPAVVEAGLDEVFSELSFSDSEIHSAVEESLASLTARMDANVTCSSELNIVSDNQPNYTISTRVGCNCDLNLPPLCRNSPTYLDDPTATSQYNECNTTTECLRCTDDACRSILPAYGCSAPFRVDVSTMGDPRLGSMAMKMGFYRYHASQLDVATFSSNALLSDRQFRDFELPQVLNFANARLAILDNETYSLLKSASSEQVFRSKGFSTPYTKIGSGAVASLDPGWAGMTEADAFLLAAHYYDLASLVLYPKVDFNCTGLLPQALATVITEYPQNGTELLVGMDKKAYVYGTVQCRDSKYAVDGHDLVLGFDFWVSLQKSCPRPSECNGTSANCQSALTLPLPRATGTCPNCFDYYEAPGVTMRHAEDGSIKCKHFSGSRVVCEFYYDSAESVLRTLPEPDRIFSVPCTCYLNGVESDCESVIGLNYTESMRPEVRCPVAVPSTSFYSDYLGVRNCGTVQDRFGYPVAGQVCDISCYDNSGEVVCGDCQPDFSDSCGCGSCAFQIHPDEYQYYGSERVYWLGDDDVRLSDGSSLQAEGPSVSARILASTCSSLLPRQSCSNSLDLSNRSETLYGGLAGDGQAIDYYTCLSPVTLRSGGTFIDVCDCGARASDPSLRTDSARYRPDYFTRLSSDPGFLECCEVCSLARLCAVEDDEDCRYKGKSCRDLLVETGGRTDDAQWPDFMTCCTGACLSSCTACSCPDSEEPFCAQPSCGLVWENSCALAAVDAAHSTCLSFSCRPSSPDTLLSRNFAIPSNASAVSCVPVQASTGCGSMGACGTCGSRLLYEVSSRWSSWSNITGFCSLSPKPSLSEACGSEISAGKHAACVEVSCQYPTGTFACGMKPAGSACASGLSGDICSACAGDGSCGGNATAEGLACLPVVNELEQGLSYYWDYNVHEKGCCCVDDLCIQKQACTGSNTVCDLDCQGFDPDCEVVSDVARGCPGCNYCSGPLCMPNTGASCGSNCTVMPRSVSGIEIGTCVC